MTYLILWNTIFTNNKIIYNINKLIFSWCSWLTSSSFFYCPTPSLYKTIKIHELKGTCSPSTTHNLLYFIFKNSIHVCERGKVYLNAQEWMRSISQIKNIEKFNWPSPLWTIVVYQAWIHFVWRFISLLTRLMIKLNWKMLSHVLKSYNSNLYIVRHVALLYQGPSIIFIFIKKQQICTNKDDFPLQ